MQILANQIAAQRLELFKRHPVDAIHRTGVDRFLDAFGAVAVLADRSGATEVRLYNKRIPCDVGAVAAADADGFINPYRSFGERSPQLWLVSVRLDRQINRRRKGQ